MVHKSTQLAPGQIARCVRCGGIIERRSRVSLHRTAAFTLAALILYVPANLFPILHLEKMGMGTDNTVWQGVQYLYMDGQWGIAGIVLMASIIIPALKLLGLFYLVATVSWRSAAARKFRTWVFVLIEGVGRWAMLDVFLMAVLVSLVKLHQLATITPGIGLTAFGAVVVLTMLASASFDPQLIWEPAEEEERP